MIRLHRKVDRSVFYGGSSVKNEQSVAVLIDEYQCKNARVDLLISAYEKSLIQQIVVFGAVLYFSLTMYEVSAYSLFVDFACCIGLPFLAHLMICNTVNYGVKVKAYGLYLYSLEQKLNLLLDAENTLRDYPFKEYVDWESWRLKLGTGADKWVHHDAIYNVLILILVSAGMGVVRLIHIYGRQTEFLCFLVLEVLFLLYFCCIITILVKRLAARIRVESKIIAGTIQAEDFFANPASFTAVKKPPQE